MAQKKTNEMNSSNKKQSRTQTAKIKTSADNVLRMIPLGGMREIGKNMTVFEYGDDIVVIDCGMAFPDNRMPGIDVIIPDTTYLMENRHKFRGVLITHGHEDHIGALPG